MDSQFKPSFLNDAWDVMSRAMEAGFDEQLRVLSDKQSKPVQRNVSRQIILHDLGNMTVLAYAGLEKVICESRQEQFNRLMLEFDKRRKKLEKLNFEIPPQVLNAISSVRSPNLWD